MATPATATPAIDTSNGIAGLLNSVGATSATTGAKMGPTDPNAKTPATTYVNPNDPQIRTKKRVTRTDYPGTSIYGSELEPEEKKKKSELLTDFYKMPSNSDELKTLQERLYRAGYYGNMKANQINFGVHDTKTAAAYADFLDQASAQTTADEDSDIQSILDEQEGQSAIDQQADPTAISLPNADDMKAIINATAPKVLGRRLDPGTTQAIMDAYTQKYVAAQEQANAAKIAGGYSVEAPTLNAGYVEDQVRAANPGEAAAHDFSDQYAAFNDLITSSAAAARR